MLQSASNMCLSPITIKNPNYGLQKKGYNWLHDCENHYIQVPCGSCAECCARRQSDLRQRIAMMSDSDFAFFQTLTLAPRYMSYLDFGEKTFRYFDISYFQKYIKMLRKYQVFGEGTKFKFIAVTEYGGSRHRPHMHVIYFIPKDDKHWIDIADISDTEERDRVLQSRASLLFSSMLGMWRYNSGTNLNPIWDNLCDYKCVWRGDHYERNFDFQAVSDNPNDKKNVGYYVSKYVMKFDKYVDWMRNYVKSYAKDPAEFHDVWFYLKPRVLCSKFLGITNIETKKKIQESKEYSLRDTGKPLTGWKFICPFTGKELPLCRYYRKHFVTIDEAIEMWFRTEDPLEHIEDDIHNIEYEKRKQHADRRQQLIRIRNDSQGLELDNDEIFDITDLV